jgi:predicted SprT family Zn-dependent metalloprotease
MDLNELKVVAAREMTKHGLYGWSFALTNAKRRLGACKYRQKRIEIAEYYAVNNPVESVHDTLMHEIAHALAGPKAGHGPKWKEIAVRLGATPRACEKSPEVKIEPGDWQATCPACYRTFHRYRRPRVLTGYRCRCKARSPIAFAFAGDSSRLPFTPRAVPQAPHWQATCAGCQTVHVRQRQPKAGLWRCRCPQRCEITWKRHFFGLQ